MLVLLLLQDIVGSDPWKDLKAGSWVTRTRTDKMGDKIKEATTRTLMVEEDGKVVRREGESIMMHLHGWAPRKEWQTGRAEERLSVEGVEMPCAVLSFAWEEKGVKGSARYWLAAEEVAPYREMALNGPDLALPPRLLKLTFENTSPKAVVKVSLEVQSLSRKHKVGERELTCVAEAAEVEEGPLKGTLKRLLSREVPGGLVERRVEGTLRGEKVESLERVVDFELKN
jgi:hypothetical protein